MAAGDAARSAAWDAAWAAARAAGDAAWASARAAQKNKFQAVFCGDSINVDCLRTKEAA